MIYSFLRKISFRGLCARVFTVSFFFLFACTKPHDQPTRFSDCLTATEKKDIQPFLQHLLFDNYGAYVLFGSKPLCELLIRDMDSPAADAAFQRFLDELPQEEKERIAALRHKTQARKTQEELDKEAQLENTYYRGWLAFQKLLDRFRLQGFVFRVLPDPRPDAYEIWFINIQQTALVLTENYEIFRQAAGTDFHPLQVVFEAEDPNSEFWKKVLSLDNHLTKGLLFGFGRKNSIFGHWTFSGRNEHLALPNEKHRKDIEDFLKCTPSYVSTDIIPQSSFSFNIPRFGAVPGDETAEKYGKERAVIEGRYRNQDMVEVTLQRLFN